MHRDKGAECGVEESTGSRLGETFPTHLCALAPANQNTLPEPAHAKFEDAQLGRVPGNSVVLVVTQHDLPEPRTDFGHAIMHPAL